MSAVGDSTPDGLDLPALERFFASHVPGFAGPLSAELLQGGRSNLTFVLTDGRQRWVLRRPPLGELTPSAHDMGREYQVVAALGGSGVPVARAVALAGPDVLGAPFSVVEYVDGRVISTIDQLHALPPADIARCAYALVDVLARLHQVEPGAVGLTEFGRADGYLGRQVRRWYDQWNRVQTRPLDDIDTLHARLAEACPAESGASIVHGDYRIDNTILDRDDPAVVLAVVDWEMATLGDPLADLGLHLVYSDPAFAPVLAGSAASTSDLLPPAADIAQRYADASGRELAHLEFYLGLGYFKIAVIAEGIHARHLQGMTRGTGFDSVGEAVAPLAAAGLRALSHRIGARIGARTGRDVIVTNVLDLFRLDGKVAVVTGASAGLGAGFSVALAQAGADVVLAARRTDRLRDVARRIEDLGRRALPVGVDIGDPDGCEAMANDAMAEFGRVDILVNNAGVGTAVPALRETPEQFRRVVDINLNGLYWAAQACGRVMEPGSSIVNISSVLALIKSYAPQAAYSASKAGVLGLTRDLAQQWSGRRGIRVNAITPGYFESEMTAEIPEDLLMPFVRQHSPFGRLGLQHELDAAVVFLASPASSYITGTTLAVDGGMSGH